MSKRKYVYLETLGLRISRSLAFQIYKELEQLFKEKTKTQTKLRLGK